VVRVGEMSQKTIKGKDVFTGDVSRTLIHQAGDYSVASVAFMPGARTYWHTHSDRQIIQVTSGSGWVSEKGKQAQRIRAGDMVVCPGKTPHWHGADTETSMTHTVLTFGSVDWHDEVTAGEVSSCQKE
jgi:quercetin dioxygenase-like cupin family protein